LNIIIHRGAKEIGGSCVEIISAGERILIDLGLPLDAGENDKKYLPNVSGLDGKDKFLLCVIISHPHLDHFGLISHISAQLPVIMGKDARRIITAAAPFMPGNQKPPADGLNLENEIPFTIGPFKITPYLMDHSGYDAYSLMIEADGKRVFYSGDFRTHGRKAKLTNKLIDNPPKDIDVLLMEGTSLARINDDVVFPKESEIEEQFREVFEKTKGISLVHTSAQNIDRIVSIFRACKKSKKTLVLDLYSAAILEATGNENIPQSDWPKIAVYIPQSQRVMILKRKWFDLLERHSKNRIFIENMQEIASDYVMLFRGLHIRDLTKAGLTKDAVYIYSQWEGYWEREEFRYIREWIKEQDIPKINIHTSGHASPSDLKKYADAINPKRLIPIHTFEPEKYKELFRNVEIYLDGEVIEV